MISGTVEKFLQKWFKRSVIIDTDCTWKCACSVKNECDFSIALLVSECGKENMNIKEDVLSSPCAKESKNWDTLKFITGCK